MNRNGMIGKIMDRTPGIYLHITFRALGYIIAIVLFIAFLLIRTVEIRLNPGPAEYPMFVDGKKIVFRGVEPRSVTEAREIMSTYRHKINDGDVIYNSGSDQ